MSLPKLLYSITEAQEILCISRTTLWRLVRRKKLKPTRVGTRVLFTLESLQDYVTQTTRR